MICCCAASRWIGTSLESAVRQPVCQPVCQPTRQAELSPLFIGGRSTYSSFLSRRADRRLVALFASHGLPFSGAGALGRFSPLGFGRKAILPRCPCSRQPRPICFWTYRQACRHCRQRPTQALALVRRHSRRSRRALHRSRRSRRAPRQRLVEVGQHRPRWRSRRPFHCRLWPRRASCSLPKTSTRDWGSWAFIRHNRRPRRPADPALTEARPVYSNEECGQCVRPGLSVKHTVNKLPFI